jgi:hypothetical protein
MHPDEVAILVLAVLDAALCFIIFEMSNGGLARLFA